MMRPGKKVRADNTVFSSRMWAKAKMRAERIMTIVEFRRFGLFIRDSRLLRRYPLKKHSSATATMRSCQSIHAVQVVIE